MTDYVKRRNGSFAVMSFGAKNPQTSVRKQLDALDMEYSHQEHRNYDRFWVTDSRNIYIIDVLDYLPDRLNMTGVVGYGLGGNQEELETSLRKTMQLMGIAQIKGIVHSDSGLFNDTVEKLDTMLQAYCSVGGEK